MGDSTRDPSVRAAATGRRPRIPTFSTVLKVSILPAALVVAAGLFLLVRVLGYYFHGVPDDARAGYVGSQKCLKCHQQQAELWHGSHHDLAMDLATEKTVLGDFSDRQFTYHGVTTKIYRRDGKFYMKTDNAQGKLQEFQVKYVFGATPLQQYMVEFPDAAPRKEGEIGRVQVLPICWDTEKKRWFHVYQDDKVLAGDPLHWTGSAQNWNYMCADCHSTNLKKNFDVQSLTYRTTFSEIDVSCEACHGPGSIHVDLAEAISPFWDRKRGYGLTVQLKGKDPTMELETCARCHSRREVLHGDYHPGRRFLDHYNAQLLHEGLYHADGQILDEVYVYGSFLQSRMHREGVRCTDCHDPHTAGPRRDEATGKPLVGNALCTRCHVPAKYDAPAHHHHAPNADLVLDGTRCVDCHMPEQIYMVVDPRRDHSLRVPRPDLTVKLGVPNACNTCHKKETETAQWAADKIVQWYGEKRPDDPHFATILAAARNGEQGAGDQLRELARRPKTAAIARATAVWMLRFYPTPTTEDAVSRALRDDDPLVRGAAALTAGELAAAGVVPDGRLHDMLATLLDDPLRSVRTTAALALSRVPRSQFTEAGARRREEVLEEYKLGQAELSDRAGSHAMLGILAGRQAEAALKQGDRQAVRQAIERAVKSYQTAIRVEPDRRGARTNLSELFDEMGRQDAAARLRREELKLLERDIGFLPDNAELRYRHGMMSYLLGDLKAAERSLAKACRLAPGSAEFLVGLVLLYEKLQRWDDAVAGAEKLVRMAPDNPTFRQMLQKYRQGRKR